ncbi:AAT22 [Candida oxycetoniae]|uniref:AAT22 n=1 Tax=Candida oxycetoniae TaxID=497107 RepID=A0AAI9STG8_9ASCO|nr:AAT22 [Candida oxycetoniae]KAI3402746.1 AAT22 [Candida oxycetoniae]
MTVQSIFSQLTKEEDDPIIKTMQEYTRDPNPGKIDVSIGVQKDKSGKCYEYRSIAEAKHILAENDPGHNYTSMAGIGDFVSGAQRLIFGDDILAERGSNIASIQAISGTGSLHIAMLFYKTIGLTEYYIGVPTWQNYGPMVKHIGGETHYYSYYDESTKSVDFKSILATLNSVPVHSVFLFQTCCHNPTGSDFTHAQWQEISNIMKQRRLIPIFDTAYQGLGSGDLDADAWPIRYFFNQGFEFAVCQSFSKNMGLYSERVGCVHVVLQDSGYLPAVQSNLVALFRKECSFAPAFGARLAAIILNNAKLEERWRCEVKETTLRLKYLRKRVLDKLTELKTPGNWTNVVEQNGLFWFSGLTSEQNSKLIKKHVYSTSMGRVNISGLNERNIDHFCRAIDEVVREE